MTTDHIANRVLSYLACREAQGADLYGLFVQLNLLDDEHLPIVVNGLVNITVFYQGQNRKLGEKSAPS